MTTDGPDRPSPDNEGSDDQDDQMFHIADTPDKPDDDDDDQEDQMFHSADVPDEDG
jgi:hypothetical protein